MNDKELTRVLKANDPVFIFELKYDSMAHMINKKGFWEKIDPVNQALTALINASDCLDRIEKYMIYNLLIVAKYFDHKSDEIYVPSRFRIAKKLLSNNLAKIESLSIKKENFCSR